MCSPDIMSVVEARPPSCKKFVFRKAGEDALKGGLAGFQAQTMNVITLMWLRTVMNYQYSAGAPFKSAAATLYNEGGIPRFYRGLIPALIQSPLCRFADTASNTGVLALLESHEVLRILPMGVKTIFCSTAAAACRVALMPIDTWKIHKQVTGPRSAVCLRQKIQQQGFGFLFHGAMASTIAAWIGHYPWYITFNSLNHSLPPCDSSPLKRDSRNAFIGFIASATSDACSNFLRVIKVIKQMNSNSSSYTEIVRDAMRHNNNGIMGVAKRGLSTRLITNGIQGMIFTVVWRSLYASD